MTQFQAGDIVVCVDSTGLSDHITQGCEYCIEGYTERYRGMSRVVIEADDNGKRCTCFEDRFLRKETI